LWLDPDQADMLGKLASDRHATPREFIERLIDRMLNAEGADDVEWFLVALNNEDNTRLRTYARTHGWDVENLLDELVGDALDGLGN
jgi:serine/threonine protein phosphatase PrpC